MLAASRAGRTAVLAIALALAGCQLPQVGVGGEGPHVRRSGAPDDGAPSPGVIPRSFPGPDHAPDHPDPSAGPGPSALPSGSPLVGGSPTPAPTTTPVPGTTAAPTATPAPGDTPTPAATSTPAATPTPEPTPHPEALPRSTTDRPDDETGFQVHMVYAVPKGNEDRGLDHDGTLARSIYAFDDWFARQTKRQRVRLDRFEGAVDITFIQLDETDAELAVYRRRIRDAIERALKRKGFNHPKKLYGVYYDGSNPEVCGGAPWPPEIPGTVASIYLKGNIGCDATGWTEDGETMGYREFSMLHELTHGLGFVPRCAPHHWNEGHTSSTWADLMYTGPDVWNPRVLDDMKELYHHDRADCLDLEDSAFLTPSVAGAAPPPRWDYAVSVDPSP
jgi:hypothetical protein